MSVMGHSATWASTNLALQGPLRSISGRIPTSHRLAQASLLPVEKEEIDGFAYSSEADCAVTQPWNKGELTGAKPPLSPKHVWAVRTRLQLLKRYRDLALFNLAIDSKLRGCDLVGLKITDVAPHGYAVDRASVRQRKTGDRFASRSPSKPARRSTTISRNGVEPLTHTSSLDAVWQSI